MFQMLANYREAFINAVLTTLQLTLLTAVFGTMLGILIAFLRMSKIRFVRWLATLYVETFLALPLLVLIIWIYFALPVWIGGLRLPPFSAALIALTINLAPFIAETLRAGFQSIPKGYALAGMSVGMSPFQIFRRITLPLVIRRTMAALMTQYVTMLKLVSLCSIIAVPEILYVGNNIISREQRPIEIYTLVAVLYLLMILPLTFLSRFFERKFVVRN